MSLFSLEPAGLRGRFALLSLAAIGMPVLSTAPAAQTKRYPLDSTAGLRLHNVTAEPAVLQGKKGLRVTPSEEARRRLQSMTPDEQSMEQWEASDVEWRPERAKRVEGAARFFELPHGKPFDP